MASAKPRNCVPSSCIRPRMRGLGLEDTGQAGEVRGTYSSHSGVSTCREGDRRVRALSLVVGQVNAMCPPPQWDRPQSPPRGPTFPWSPHRTRSAAGMPLPRLPAGADACTWDLGRGDRARTAELGCSWEGKRPPDTPVPTAWAWATATRLSGFHGNPLSSGCLNINSPFPEIA